MEKYEIKNKLGVGAHGAVFLVQEKPSKKQYALKKIEVDERTKSRSRQSVLKEASILSQLRHQHIVLFHESFWNPKDECVYILLDYCGGGNLADKISEAQVSIPFTERQIMQWFIQIVMAVQYIHSKHILHRDLKSENVFLNKRNVVKVGDFGISKVLANTIDVAKTVVGTPSYLSPELCQDIPYNSKSDIWAVGCLLYELCALHPPFDGNSLFGLMCNIVNSDYKPLPADSPDGVQDLVQLMLVKLPEGRPSASAVLNHPYVKQNLASFISDTESILSVRGSRRIVPPPVSHLDERGDHCGMARPSTAPPKRQTPPKVKPKPKLKPSTIRDLTISNPIPANTQMTTTMDSVFGAGQTMPQPYSSPAKGKSTPAKCENNQLKVGNCDDPSEYSDDFDESSDSEIEEDLPKELEEKVGKSEEEMYADDFEEYETDEDLNLLVAQAKEAQDLEPMDEYFVEPEDELGLSQTLAMVQAGLITNKSDC